MVPLWKKWLLMLLVVLLGAPWGFVQSVAWVSMLTNYSRQTSFTEAVTMTFDGKHPCPLCLAVQKGRAEEQQKDQKQACSQDDIQLDLPPLTSVVLYPPSCEESARPTVFAPTRTEPPPSPPPRAA